VEFTSTAVFSVRSMAEGHAHWTPHETEILIGVIGEMTQEKSDRRLLNIANRKGSKSEIAHKKIEWKVVSARLAAEGVNKELIVAKNKWTRFRGHFKEVYKFQSRSRPSGCPPLYEIENIDDRLKYVSAESLKHMTARQFALASFLERESDIKTPTLHVLDTSDVLLCTPLPSDPSAALSQKTAATNDGSEKAELEGTATSPDPALRGRFAASAASGGSVSPMEEEDRDATKKLPIAAGGRAHAATEDSPVNIHEPQGPGVEASSEQHLEVRQPTVSLICRLKKNNSTTFDNKQ